MSFDKFKKGDQARQYLSREFLEKTLGYRTSVSKRFNPFSDDILLSVEDTMEMDETGYIRDSKEADEVELTTTTIVRRALNRLPKLEREILVRYYFQGLTCPIIAEELGKKTEVINNARLRAIERMERLVTEEKLMMGLTADFNYCDICNHPENSIINEKIHVWLDAHNWKTQGLITVIEHEYNIKNITKDSLTGHIDYHMGLANDISILAELEQDTQRNTVQINVSVPVDIGSMLETMTNEYGVSKPFLVRQSLKYGLNWLQMMLLMNERMFLEQLRLAQVMRRVFI